MKKFAIVFLGTVFFLSSATLIAGFSGFPVDEWIGEMASSGTALFLCLGVSFFSAYLILILKWDDGQMKGRRLTWAVLGLFGIFFMCGGALVLMSLVSQGSNPIGS